MDNSLLKYYWFNIDSHVHISLKSGNVLFYNVFSGKILEFHSHKYGHIIRDLTKKLLSPRNLRVIRLTSNDLDNPIIKEFVELIRKFFMGDLIDTEFSGSKPFQAAPTRTKVHFDVRNHLKDKDLNLGNKIIEYLFEFTLYLNKTCYHQCTECKNLYKQFIWCKTSQKKMQYLEINLLEKLFKEVKGSHMNNINITGGNILLYPYYEHLFNIFKSVDYPIYFYLHHLNISENPEILSKLELIKSVNHRFYLLCHSLSDFERFKISYEKLSLIGLNVKPVFTIQNEKEYLELNAMISGFPEEDIIFLPFYNGENLEFFKSNFYVSRSEVGIIKPEQRKIDGNSKINMNNFGKLTILTNGNVHANVMTPSLGNLKRNSIYDCIFKEMKNGRNWFRIRSNILPCKQCNFELLCPPLSNYNRVIGRNNLCDIAT